MKNFSSLTIKLLCIVFLLVAQSCTKDTPLPEFEEPINSEVISNQKAVVNNTTNSSCSSYNNLKRKFCHSRFTSNNGHIFARINVQTESGNFTIQAIKNEAEELDFLVTPPKGDAYVVSNTNYWYFREATDEKHVVLDELKSLYLFADLVEKRELNGEAISERLGGQAKVLVMGNRIRIKFPDNFQDAKLAHIPAIAMPLCLYDKVNTVRKYINNIGFTTQNNTYETTVESAINACVANNTEFCAKCVDPICVFQGLIATFAANNHVADVNKTKKAFVKYSLGLSNNEVNLLAGYPTITNSLYSYLTTSSQDFCDRVANTTLLANSFVLYLNNGGGASTGTTAPTGVSTLIDEAFQFLLEENYNIEAQQALQLVLHAASTNALTLPHENIPPSIGDGIIGWTPNSFTLILEIYEEYTLNCLLLRKENPNWSDAYLSLRAMAKALKNIVHTGLDLCGLIPAGGIPCDLVNGVLYVIEGDGLNASISFAATLPIVGWLNTGAKWAKIGVDTADGFKALRLTLNQTTGKIIFSHQSKFRNMVGVTSTAQEAHHLIPWSKRNHDLVQHAAKATTTPYHINHVKNGMPLDKFRYDYPNGVHASHPQYNMQVESKMSEIIDNLKNQYNVSNLSDVPPNVASDALIDFQNSLRTLIENNPNTKINDLIIP